MDPSQDEPNLDRLGMVAYALGTNHADVQLHKIEVVCN